MTIMDENVKPARGDADLPQATHEGSVDILGVRCRVYRLDDGRTVIAHDDFAALLEAMIGDEQP